MQLQTMIRVPFLRCPNRRWKAIGLLVATAIISGCATIPKEAVELSYLIGYDLEQLQNSYRTLLHEHFDDLRLQRQDFLEEKLIPVYLAHFIDSGGLLELIQPGDPPETFDGVHAWVEVAVAEIESMRHDLIAPIDSCEQSLLQHVDAAFAQVMRSNAMVTAHLRSIRKVNVQQDLLLQKFGLGQLRDEITAGLAAASVRADAALQEVSSARGFVEQVDATKAKLLEKLKQ